jgi:hypothetical protein
MPRDERFAAGSELAAAAQAGLLLVDQSGSGPPAIRGIIPRSSFIERVT